METPVKTPRRASSAEAVGLLYNTPRSEERAQTMRSRHERLAEVGEMGRQEHSERCRAFLPRAYLLEGSLPSFVS